MDNETSLGGQSFNQFLKNRGIQKRCTTPHNSEQNGRAEITNHLVTVLARKLMIAGHVPKHLWPEAVRAATYMLNITPSKSLGMKSPYTCLAEQQHAVGNTDWPLQPNVSNLRAYGCVTYVLDQSIKRGDKFAPRALKGKLVGYEVGSHTIYRVYVPSLRKVVRSVNVSFNEDCFDLEEGDNNDGVTPDADLGNNTTVKGVDTAVDTTAGGEYTATDTTSGGEGLEVPSAAADMESFIPELGSPQNSPPEPILSSRPRRITAETEKGALYRQEREFAKQRVEAKKQRRAAAAADQVMAIPRKTHVAFMAGVRHSEGDIVIPNTFEEAMQSPQAQQWKEACNAEYQCLIDNTTWKLMPLPSGASLVKGKWVFGIKKDVDSNPVRFKARWVARGFTQKQGVDYDDTYASVTKPSTVRVLLSIVAAYDMECKQFDAITAFLNSTISEHKIYVEQPHGYEQQLNGQGAVCLLLKALYGLKQSPLLWYQELTKFLNSVHFTPMWSDACLFHHRQSNVFLLIYVDDFLIAGNLEGISAAAELLGNKFKLKALGDVHYYLGCRIVRNRPNRKIYLLQDGYIKRVGGRFKQQLMNHHNVETPVDPRFRFKTQDEQANKHNISLYQQLVGSLMWLAQMSRPEIIFAVHQLSKYLTNPSSDHIAQAVRTMAYVI
ncbi:MAG: hypothetical protein FE78DRAFT_28434 [Acidomyces sp. 'richmondensis']|nr:MAG: hypothetical protein FE78DRAFT_28434 [Acidomyces sp. 'richmondensis']